MLKCTQLRQLQWRLAGQDICGRAAAPAAPREPQGEHRWHGTRQHIRYSSCRQLRQQRLWRLERQQHAAGAALEHAVKSGAGEVWLKLPVCLPVAHAKKLLPTVMPPQRLLHLG